jgi:hypothetical protein
MVILPRLARPIKPTATYSYLDKVQVWLRKPIKPKTVLELGGHCGRGGIYAENRPARFDPNFRQRLEFKQPNQQALRWIAYRDDALINQVEVVLDLIFEDIIQKEDAWTFFNQHLIRRWHGKKQEIRVVKSRSAAEDNPIGTRYDAGRWAPNVIAVYAEDHSRVTGELHCLHLEWRLNGLKAVRSGGIKSSGDLLEFDYRQFWQTRLVLYTIDPERLGRLVRNHASGTRSRTAEIGQWGGFNGNIDGKKGRILVRGFDTIQELIDHFGRTVRVHRALVLISSSQLLPVG